MLTTVNMPAVTAWAQDDKAGTAEIAADETKTPVSAEMTTTKTVFPYGEEAGLGPYVNVEITYDDGTSEKLDCRYYYTDMQDQYDNSYEFLLGTGDQMIQMPQMVSESYKGKQTLSLGMRNRSTDGWDILASTEIEIGTPAASAEPLQIGENRACLDGIYKFTMPGYGKLSVAYTDGEGESHDLHCYLAKEDGSLENIVQPDIYTGGATYYFKVGAITDYTSNNYDNLLVNVSYEQFDTPKLGENIYRLEAGESKYLDIVPEEDARYILETKSSQSRVVELYYGDGNEVEDYSEYGLAYNSKVRGREYDLVAGVHYIAKLENNSSTDAVDASLRVNTIESAYKGYTELVMDSPVSVDSPAVDDEQSFVFTPDADGTYMFITRSTERLSVDIRKIGDRGTSVRVDNTNIDDRSLSTATLEKDVRYFVILSQYYDGTDDDTETMAPFSVEATKKRTASSVKITMAKDTFAPNDFKDIVANMTLTAVYDDGYEEILPSPEPGSDGIYDKVCNEYSIIMDGNGFWSPTYIGTNLDKEYKLSVQNEKGVTLGETTIKFGLLSEHEYSKVDIGDNDIDAYTYYSFTVPYMSSVSCVLKNETYYGPYINIFDEHGHDMQSWDAPVFFPGHTYYIYGGKVYDEEYNGITHFTVTLKADKAPDLTDGECTADILEDRGRTYLGFHTTKAGKYTFTLPDIKDDGSEDYSFYVMDTEGKTKGRGRTYANAELAADTDYVVEVYMPSSAKSVRVTAKRKTEPESAVITMAKTDYVVDMDANYFYGMKLTLNNDDGTTSVIDNIKSAYLIDGTSEDVTIYYSMNGGKKYMLSANVPMTKTGVMTIYVMLGDKVIGSCDVNIKAYDQVEIPELKEGDNPDTVLFRFYKFTATADQSAVFEADDSYAYFEVYKLEDGKFAKVDSEAKLSAGETYYCKAWRKYGNSNDQTDVKLSFQTIKKLTAIKVTGLDRPLYNLGSDAMMDSFPLMKQYVHYTLIYNDGSEEKHVLTDTVEPQVISVIWKNGDRGLNVQLKCGDLSDTLEIPFADPATAPTLTLKDNKAHIDLTDAGQYVYKFKAPVTGYYNLEVSMPDGYYECYSNFYKDTELDTQPYVDMNQRLVKAGETYYVCIYAYNDTLDINLVCKPQIKAATTTADGVKIISKKVGTGDDAHYELTEEKIAKIKSVTLAATSYTYDTKAKKPAVAVKDSAGKVITASNYTVTYTNNTNVGTATATITFKGSYSGTVTRTFAIKKFAAPAASRITKLENTAKGITVTWTASANATSYEIYRSMNGGKFAKADTLYIKGTSKQQTLGYADLKAKTNGGKYAYKIIAVRTLGNVTVKSAASAGVTSYYMAVPSGIKAANSAKRIIKIAYAANAKATGYQIRYSLKSNMSGAKVIKMTGSKSIAKNITGLTKGKKYYVSVRSYKTVGKTTYYSVWSTPKGVTVSK